MLLRKCRGAISRLPTATGRELPIFLAPSYGGMVAPAMAGVWRLPVQEWWRLPVRRELAGQAHHAAQSTLHLDRPERITRISAGDKVRAVA